MWVSNLPALYSTNSTKKHTTQHTSPEVLSLLPPYKGKRILELASGIGRFTG